MCWNRWVLRACVSACILLVATPVFAQESAATEEARALFTAGRVAYDAGRYEDALARFREAHEISGPRGVKFDLLQLLDVDGDGDLDVLTCEERHNLGVVWYENPARNVPPGELPK